MMFILLFPVMYMQVPYSGNTFSLHLYSIMDMINFSDILLLILEL